MSEKTLRDLEARIRVLEEHRVAVGEELRILTEEFENRFGKGRRLALDEPPRGAWIV